METASARRNGQKRVKVQFYKEEVHMNEKFQDIFHDIVLSMGYLFIGLIIWSLLFGSASIGDLQVGGWLK